MLYSEQPTILLAQRHLNTMFLTNFENLNFIFNIFQKTQDFLVLADPVIICIYLRTIGIHLCDQRTVRHPTSKLLKCDLIQTLNTFWNPSFPDFLLPVIISSFVLSKGNKILANSLTEYDLCLKVV